MRKVLFITMLLLGSLASAGAALDFQEFDPSVDGSRIVALARDDGRYANSPLKSWFDRLARGNGLCCSFADGFRVDDVAIHGHRRANSNSLLPSRRGRVSPTGSALVVFQPAGR